MKTNNTRKTQYSMTTGLKAGTCNIPQADSDAVAKSCCNDKNPWACRQFEMAIAPRGCTSDHATCIKGVQNES